MLNLNKERDSLIDELALWENDKTKTEADLQVAELMVTESENEISELVQNFNDAYISLSRFIRYL